MATNLICITMCRKQTTNTAIWNGLPDHIKNSESVSTLQQRLKTFLFMNDYYIIVYLDFIYCCKRIENSLNAP